MRMNRIIGNYSKFTYLFKTNTTENFTDHQHVSDLHGSFSTLRGTNDQG